MRFFGKNKMIHVEFVDVETGQPFAETDMPPENLPETFVLNTTLHLGDEDWSVISAEPMNSSEFLQTGQLRLVLQKVAMVDPSKILFSMPSICNSLAEVDEVPKTTGSELTVHEDNWRNIELISRAQRNEIVTNLKAIYRIHNEESVGQGFKTMHLREDILFPFKSVNLPLSELDNFEKTKTFSGLSFLNQNKIVIDGFAFLTTGGITWFGRQKDGLVRELCIATCASNDQTMKDVEILVKLMEKYDLVFVDWCRVVLLNSSEENDLKSYFLQVHGS